MNEAAISVAGLRKSYGALEALKGVDLEVSRGEVFALLGPNGSGITTMVEILEGYRERDAGEATVPGIGSSCRTRREGRAASVRIGNLPDVLYGYQDGLRRAVAPGGPIFDAAIAGPLRGT